MIKKTPFYIEKYLGLLIGSILGLFSIKFWGVCSFICGNDFFDKSITISTTLFGFLLTVLTLIVQSNSPIITDMKRHGSYKRLILFNKSTVLLSAIVCFISLILICSKDKLKELDVHALSIPSWINFVLFIWSLVDTFIFVFIFYKILISDSNDKP